METEETNEQPVEDNEETEEDMKAVVICRGYVIYAKSDKGELYDFFYPALQNRITIGEAESLLPDEHKLLTTERVTRYYEIPMKQLDEYGKIIH
jgi:hypothetical protein